MRLLPSRYTTDPPPPNFLAAALLFLLVKLNTPNRRRQFENKNINKCTSYNLYLQGDQNVIIKRDVANGLPIG